MPHFQLTNCWKNHVIGFLKDGTTKVALEVNQDFVEFEYKTGSEGR